MEDRKCLDCGNVIFGRVDKKFCSDQCRNTYNNQLKRDSNNLVRNLNHLLGKNRRILSELNPEGKTKVHRDRLTSRGFHFHFFTHTYVTKAGTTYFFCYEQGYLPLENDFYALVTREPRI